MPRHTLSKLDLLEYALEGIQTRIGTSIFETDEDYEFLATLEADKREIQKRIKLCQIANAKKDNPC